MKIFLCCLELSINLNSSTHTLHYLLQFILDLKIKFCVHVFTCIYKKTKHHLHTGNDND